MLPSFALQPRLRTTVEPCKRLIRPTYRDNAPSNINLETPVPSNRVSAYGRDVKPLHEMWGQVRSCFPLSLGPALLQQGLQGTLSSESSARPCAREKVVRLLCSRDELAFCGPWETRPVKYLSAQVVFVRQEAGRRVGHPCSLPRLTLPVFSQKKSGPPFIQRPTIRAMAPHVERLPGRRRRLAETRAAQGAL
jgi:hypothetical protein